MERTRYVAERVQKVRTALTLMPFEKGFFSISRSNLQVSFHVDLSPFEPGGFFLNGSCAPQKTPREQNISVSFVLRLAPRTRRYKDSWGTSTTRTSDIPNDSSPILAFYSSTESLIRFYGNLPLYFSARGRRSLRSGSLMNTDRASVSTYSTPQITHAFSLGIHDGDLYLVPSSVFNFSTPSWSVRTSDFS